MEGGRNGGGGMRGRIVNFGESWGFSEPYGEGRERGVLVPCVYSKGYKGTEMMKSVRIHVLGSKRLLDSSREGQNKKESTRLSSYFMGSGTSLYMMSVRIVSLIPLNTPWPECKSPRCWKISTRPILGSTL